MFILCCVFAPEGEWGGGERSDRGCVWKRLPWDGVSGGGRSGLACSRVFPDAESQLRTCHRSGLLAGWGRTVTARVATTDHHHCPDHSEQHRSEYTYSVHGQAREFASWSSSTCAPAMFISEGKEILFSISAKDPRGGASIRTVLVWEFMIISSLLTVKKKILCYAVLALCYFSFCCLLFFLCSGLRSWLYS